jgi:mxaJ protein
MFSRCRNSAPSSSGRPVVPGRIAIAVTRRAGLMACCALALSSFAGAEGHRVLRVAADPNNLPFSNRRCEGFENKILELVARQLGATIEYTWRAQRRGFFRETMREGNCDVVAGVPRGFDPVLTTAPYYRSVYVIVHRAGEAGRFDSLDDPALRKLTLGVQMIGDDFANTPPALALARRGIVDNVRGYTLYGNYQEPNPPARIVDAVARGEIDVACVWGPLAGYFVRQYPGKLTLSELPAFDGPSQQPFAFDIAMGVRKTNRALRDELNTVLATSKPEIDAILAEFGVPRVDRP